LASNVVYDAQIVLQDVLGRRTTNEWTFDTYTDAYLASSAVKTIEVEDYDFNSGLFINDPPASGYANYDIPTESGTLINSGSGYVDQVGSNAKTGGVDFFDYDGGPKQFENMYRHADAVGTQAGNFGDYVYAEASTLPYALAQSYDTQRSKYSSLDPTLQEYVVDRTEGGEWLNYTRVFDGSKTYNAYLRVGGGLAQRLELDQIAAGPTTNNLGRFNIASTFYVHNYRYVPLVTANGDLATINLSGTNTLRLTIDSLQNDATKFGLALNYVVLVPAAPLSPKLYSSPSVNGSYTEEASAVVNTTAKTITVAQSGSTRFYRIGWTSAVHITGITRSGGNVVLTYQ
jgi:hypothetical protein